MIQFPCTGCHQVFLVSDDEAGRHMQCPSCGRVNDVPIHSNLAEDSAFKLSKPSRPAPRPAKRQAVAGVDDEAQVTDLRNAPEELNLKPAGPQNDAETVELVQPLPVIPAAAIPMAVVAPAKAVTLNYAPLGDPALKRQTSPRELRQPANLAVVAFVLLGLGVGYILQHIVQELVIAISDEMTDFPVWPLNLLFWLAAAHFGNTIVAMGPEEHDELPRPLLSLVLWDDIFAPMLKVLGAVLLCYAPMFAVLAVAVGRGRVVALPLMLAGGYYFPAVLLTVMTSGSITNLQPKRLRAVIRYGGKRYLLLAMGWTIAFPAYVWAALRVNMVFSSLGIESGPYHFSEILLAGPLAIATVLYLHYFCWQLGLMFRAGHHRFGWVWEELVRQQEEDRKSRGSLSAADRVTMRSAREERAAAAERAARQDPRSRMGRR